MNIISFIYTAVTIFVSLGGLLLAWAKKRDAKDAAFRECIANDINAVREVVLTAL